MKLEKKIKVALVCHFSNAAVREHLPLSKRQLYTIGRKLLGLSSKSAGYGDLAGWDTYMIELLRQRKDIELYVISAHSGLKKRNVNFELKGVHYSFVRVEGATLLKHLIPSPALWHKMNPIRPVVRRLVRSIKPDVLALIGAENAHISDLYNESNSIVIMRDADGILNKTEAEQSKFLTIWKNSILEYSAKNEKGILTIYTDQSKQKIEDSLMLDPTLKNKVFDFELFTERPSNLSTLLPDLKPYLFD